MSPKDASKLRLGKYEVDLAAGRVTDQGRRLPLNWKSFQALRLLVEARGSVVERDELFRRLWPEAEVDESTLAKCISQLRQGLTDGHPGTEYVETIPRVGYRLAMPVEEISAQAPAPAPARWSGRRRWLLGVGVLAGLAAGGWLGWRWWPQRLRLREADAAYAKGVEAIRKPGPAGAAEAMPYLQRAIELNPRSARFYGTLAHAINRAGAFEVERGSGSLTTALEAAERSVALDPRCGECQGTLGFFLFLHAWQWTRAEQHYQQALRLSPDELGIRPSYAMLLAATGRLPEALEQIDQGLRANRYQLSWLGIRAGILYSMRRYPEAIAAADQALSIDRNEKGAWDWRSRALFLLGRNEEAIRALAAGPFSSHAQQLQAAYGRGGTSEGLRQLLQITEGWSGRQHCLRRARWKVLLGDDEGALEELEIAYQSRNIMLMWLGVDPAHDRLQGHPRFRKILSDMGLGPELSRPQGSRRQ